jgi:hypothetical protein
MRIKAEVAVTGQCIRQHGMHDPVFRDVQALLGESLWQQIMNNVTIKERRGNGRASHEYIYSVTVDVVEEPSLVPKEEYEGTVDVDEIGAVR